VKKLLLFLVVVSLLSLSVLSAGAQSANPASMAQYFPANTELFFSMRTDDAFVAEVDAIFADVLAKIPAELGIPPISLSTGIDLALAEQGTNLAELRTWLGDSFALGITDLAVIADDDPGNDDTALAIFALAINDQAAFDAFLQSVGGEEFAQAPRIEQDGFIVYTAPETADDEVVVAIGSDVVLIQVNSTALPFGFADSLASNADYQSISDALPAASYNALGYINLPAFFAGAMESASSSDLEDLAALGFDPTAVGGAAFGMTILDGRTFTMDFAQSIDSQVIDVTALPTVDLAFASNIPAGAELVMHGTDLSSSLRGMLETISEIAPEGEPDPVEQLTQGINAIGLDLEADILSWTKGNYAAYVDLDTDAVLAAVSANSPNFDTLPVDMGVLLEATDKDAAERLATSLGNTLTGILAQEEMVTVSASTVGDVPVTSISGVIPVDGAALPFEMTLGANSEAFFFSTRGGAEFLVGNEPGLNTDPVFNDAAQYFLPNPYLVLYTNDTGFLTILTVPTLTLLGPAIQNVFDEIVDELETGYLPDVPTMRYVQDDPMQMVMLGIQAYQDIMASSSVTAAVVGDAIVSRAVFTIDR